MHSNLLASEIAVVTRKTGSMLDDYFSITAHLVVDVKKKKNNTPFCAFLLVSMSKLAHGLALYKLKPRHKCMNHQ